MTATDPVRRRSPLLLVNLATLFSATGNGIVMVVLPWLALEQSGRASDAALVAGATTLPLLLSSLFSGTIIDRFGRRRCSLVSDALSTVSVSMIPVVSATSGLSVVSIALLAALGSAFDPAGIAARESMLPAATRTAGWTLDRANSVYEANYNAAYLVGPGIGGLLVATIGAVNALWATGFCFLLSIAAVAGVRLEHAGRPENIHRPTSIWHGTLAGLRFVWNDRLLRTLALVDMALVALYMPVESVLFPVYFTELEKPAQLGTVLMALSTGGIVGALAYGPAAPYLSRRKLLIGASVVLGAAMVAMAFLPPLGVILALAALQGFVFGPVGPIVNYAMQTHSPEHMRGRVVGVMTSTAYAAGPLGFLVAGPMLDRLGVQPTFFALAIPVVVLGLACLAMPSLRQLDPERVN